jgi:hypothetical protein
MNSRLIKILKRAALIGAGFPLFIYPTRSLLSSWLLENNLRAFAWLEGMTVILWPTFLAMAPIRPQEPFPIDRFILSVTVNALLYCIIGAVIWLIQCALFTMRKPK